MFSLASRLRHGALAGAGSLWRPLGRSYRAFQAWTRIPATARKRLGAGGHFVFDGRFAFSNFESWGDAHNANFAAWIEACRGATSVFDVGAHIGLTTLPVARALAGRGRVFAFEPGDSNARFLRRHLELNALDNVEVVSSLVGDTTEEAVDLFEVAGDSGLNTIVPGYLDDRATRRTRQQVTLDDFCRDRGLRPDVIKIDVEGAEGRVLEGARAVLKEFHPVLFLSIHPKQVALLGDSVEGILDFLHGLSYRAFDSSGNEVDTLKFAEYRLVHRGK